MNELAEVQVLNKIIKNKDISVISLNNLTTEYFDTYKDEFRFIQNHYERFKTIPDYETVVNNFPHFEVIDVQEKDSYLVQELINNRNERKLIDLFNNMRGHLMNNEIDEALNLFKNSSGDIRQANTMTCVDILKDTSRYEAYVDRLTDFDKYYVQTGLPELDTIIGGWDREEELAVIMARTNVGKSWLLLLFVVAAVKQGLNVGLYSGEMTERKVGYRVDTLLSHISNGGLIHGNSGIQNDYKRYIDELPNMFTGSLKVLTPAMIDGPAGVNALRMFIQKEKLDILFIDQHSLLEDDRKARNPVEKASNISKDLKNLQVIERIPIISVSQQNRTETEDDKLDASQMAQSDRIAQDATTIIGITRDKKDNTLMTIHGVKSRDNENGFKLTYQVDLNRGLFNYVPDAKDGTKGHGSEQKDYEHRYDNDTSVEGNVF